jgi:hypothetical protein
VVGVVVCYSGGVEQGDKVLRPLRTFGAPLIDLIGPEPYVALQVMFDPLVPHGHHHLPRCYTLVFQLGGAVARVAEDATAHSHRNAGYSVNINAAWTSQDGDGQAHISWCRELFAAVEPAATGVYVNFLGSEGTARHDGADQTARTAQGGGSQ